MENPFAKIITEEIPVMVAFVDDQEVYRYVNHQYGEYFNKGVNEIINKPVAEVVGKENYSKINSYVRRALSGEDVKYSIQLNTPQGPQKVIARYIPHVNQNDCIDGISVLIERTRHNDHINIHIPNIENKNNKLVHLYQKTLARLSHDLRDSFSVILGFAQHLQDNHLSLSRENLLQISQSISSVGQNAYTQLEQILGWTQKKLNEDEQTNYFQIREVCLSVIQSLDSLIQNRNINMALDCPAHLTLLGKKWFLTSVLRYLVKNAIDHSSAHDTVSISIQADFKQCYIRVRDAASKTTNRPGIYLEEKLTSGLPETEMGTLMIHDFIDQCSGSINIKSGTECGFEVTLIVPLKALSQ